MGDLRNYTIGDTFARYKPMTGFNAWYPMGYASFGLPAEAGLIKMGIHPMILLEPILQELKGNKNALALVMTGDGKFHQLKKSIILGISGFSLKCLKKGLLIETFC